MSPTTGWGHLTKVWYFISEWNKENEKDNKGGLRLNSSVLFSDFRQSLVIFQGWINFRKDCHCLTDTWIVPPGSDYCLLSCFRLFQPLFSFIIMKWNEDCNWVAEIQCSIIPFFMWSYQTLNRILHCSRTTIVIWLLWHLK